MFVLCTLLSATAVFLPSVELQLDGAAIHRKSSLSLYQANTNRDFVRKLVSSYHHETGARVGAALVAVLAPRSAGRLGSVLGDVHDATTTLDDVEDSDARTLGRVLAITIWVFLLLHAVMAGIVLADTVNNTVRRGRTIGALAISVVVTAIALGTYLVTKEAVWEANDEIGRTFVGVGSAAYAIPIASCAGLAAVIALLVLQVRATRPSR